MQAQALKKYIRSSPLKMRITIDMIRGKKASEALSILRFSNKMAARDAERVLRSAISNLSNKLKDAEERVNESEFFVKEVFVNEGPSMKRIMPAPMGRAFRIRKRSNHLTIVVATKEN
ncbi:MAG: 50S ribosomal protein L22 [Chloroflexota bacterium]